MTCTTSIGRLHFYAYFGRARWVVGAASLRLLVLSPSIFILCLRTSLASSPIVGLFEGKYLDTRNLCRSFLPVDIGLLPSPPSTRGTGDTTVRVGTQRLLCCIGDHPLSCEKGSFDGGSWRFSLRLCMYVSKVVVVFRDSVRIDRRVSFWQ